MYLQSTFELTMCLDSEKFYKLLDKVYSSSEYSECSELKIVDQTMAAKGIIVTYCDKRKKKIQLTVNVNYLLDGDEPDKSNADKLIRKLEKQVNKYFDSSYTLDDFSLSKISMSTDIQVGGGAQTAAYIKVLQRIGKVKGFSPSRNNSINDNISFCLDGNSNGFEFAIYDLENLLLDHVRNTNSDCKDLRKLASKSKGLLRVEVRLVKSTAIRTCIDDTLTTDQIATLCGKTQKIFLKVFQRVVPFGDFYKKDKATEIIRTKIADTKTRRRMLRLVALAPEKKSLLLAQKALNYRRIDDVMEGFADIEVSPITISKRHDVNS